MRTLMAFVVWLALHFACALRWGETGAYAWLLGSLGAIELWYWGWYFPRAWRGEVHNRQVQDLKYGLCFLYGRRRSA